MFRKASTRDFMAANVVTFRPEQPVLEAIHMLLERRISGAPVVDSRGNIVGLLSEKDCLKVALEAGYDQHNGGAVGEFMSTEVTSVEGECSIMTVAKMFLDTPYKRFPVVEDNRLVGQISRRDVLRAVQELSRR